MNEGLAVHAEPGDPHLDLTFQVYRALREHRRGDLRSCELLRRSATWSADPGALERCFARLQNASGPHSLIWAASLHGDAPAWEIYRYIGAAPQPTSVSALRSALPSAVQVAENWPGDEDLLSRFDPWSFDLDDGILQGTVPMSESNGYVNAGTEAALSYRIGPHGLETRNLYRRFRSTEQKAVQRAASRMVHLRGMQEIASVAPATYHEIHLAQKRAADGVYWVGVPLDEAVQVATSADPSGRLAEVLADPTDRLGHLGVDLGTDVVRRHGSLTITKVALYGVL